MQLDAWPMLEYLVSLNGRQNDNALEWFIQLEQYKHNTKGRVRQLFRMKLVWELLHSMAKDPILAAKVKAGAPKTTSSLWINVFILLEFQHLKVTVIVTVTVRPCVVFVFFDKPRGFRSDRRSRPGRGKHLRQPRSGIYHEQLVLRFYYNVINYDS